MVYHAPENYQCPFCLLVQGIKNPHVLSVADDIVCQDDTVTAFISSHQWSRNQGHVIVIPNAHYENIFDLPLELAPAIHGTARRIALAMKKAYGCAGISTRQHNEPHGNQDVWHYHLHVFPRYENDELYRQNPAFMSEPMRAYFAARLRSELDVE